MLTPEEIATRQFLVSLRGYDRDEVTAFLQEVAEEHRQLQERVRELDTALAEARRQGAAVEVSAAPSPAPSTAVEAAAPATPSVAMSPREAFAALGEETTRILVAAEESGQAIRDKAEERARVELENARREARDEVEGARRTASKIVADAERRRNTIAEDIRTLEATRDTFMQDLRVAMKGVQGAVRGMQTTSGTTQLQADDDTGEGERGQLQAERTPEPPLASRPRRSAASAPAPAEDSLDADPVPVAAAPVVDEPDASDTAEPDTASEPDTTSEPEAVEAPEPTPAEDEPVAAAAPVVDEAPAPAPEAATEVEEPAADAAEDESSDDSDDLDFLSEVLEEDDVASEAAADHVEADEDADDTVAASALAASAATMGHDDVADVLGDEDEDEPVADEPVAEDTPAAEEAPAAEEPAAPAQDVPVRGDVDPLPLREQSLAGVRPGMLRRLKRALQDVQNGTLDALRQAGDRPEVDELLPGDDDLAPLGAVGQMFLTAAYRAGVADGAILVDREAGDDVGDESRVPAASATFRAVISHEITSALRATLRAGVEAGEPETSLSERVGETFRDLKGPVVEQAVDQHLSRVYGFGQVDVWRHLGVQEAVWVAGSEPRCPANRCRLNEQEGPVAVGTEFPSGDTVPPAHDGCTCGLAPR